MQIKTDRELLESYATDRTTPRQVPGLAGVTFITAGGDHTVVLKHDKDKTVWAWGGNQHGQLGDGTTRARSIPVEVKMQDGRPLTNVVTIAVGESHTVAMQGDGTLWSWGLNDSGQLGDGTTVSRLTPVRVSGLAGAIARSRHDFSNGIPVRVSELPGVTAIAAGRSHTVALKNDGTLWSWGDNRHGQLGDGTGGMGASNRLTPAPVPGLAGVIAIAARADHTVVLKSDGTLWSWGRNDNGQLGDGTTTDRTTPMHSPALSGVIQFATGEGHTVVLKSDGTLWSWGLNDGGQIGDGTLVNRLRPVQVTMKDGTLLSNVACILSAGYGHTVVLIAEKAKSK